MSDFAVEVRSIGALAVHPNADKLEIAQLNGLLYPFVVGKGSFYVNELVVYFPLDSVIPAPLAALIGLPVKEDKPFRVKAIRLRGAWSQGVLAPLSIMSLDGKLAEDGLDLTEALGVTKYEPPIAQGNDLFKGIRPDNLQALPTTVHHYDIENLQRYPEVYDALVGQRVFITEKLEGTHFWARLDKDGETVHVGQRNFEIKRGDTDAAPTHPFWKTFYKENLDVFLYWLGGLYRGYDVTIRGELIGDGVQGNYYELPAGVLEIFLFEIELNGEPVDAEVFLDLIGTAQSQFKSPPPRCVPVLWKYRHISEVAPSVEEMVARANGNSALVDHPKLREGIVIKPARESYAPAVGRLFIKVRDAAYLAQ